MQSNSGTMENFSTSSTNYFIDPGIIVKTEPCLDLAASADSSQSSALSGPPAMSASVPIPTGTGRPKYAQPFTSFVGSSSSFELGFDALSTLSVSHTDHHSVVDDSGREIIDVVMNMDDDDIFQVDKADLIQGPTLAELNANDDTLLADLNFDDLLLPDENPMYGNNEDSSRYTQSVYSFNNNSSNTSFVMGSSCPVSNPISYYREFESNNDLGTLSSSAIGGSGVSVTVSKSTPSNTIKCESMNNSPVASPMPRYTAVQQKHSALHELLRKPNPHVWRNLGPTAEQSFGSGSSSTEGINIPNHPSVTSGGRLLHAPHIAVTSRLSSSAPTHSGFDTQWQRREPRKHLLSTGSLVEAGSTSSISTGGVLSPEAYDFSHDDLDDDSGDEDSHYEDLTSENDDSENEDEPENGGHRPRTASTSSSSSKKERFFWQYNVQAKGPKGQRLVIKTRMENPHILNEITDPVFSSECSVRGIKHSGKARKGDGNDLTPNPRKLHSIGRELDKLGRVINDMTPVSELPFNVRPKTRKEKNKLASRACRLKKKAQHEANKIKLQGLETEHKRLIGAITQVKNVLTVKVSSIGGSGNQEELNSHMEKVGKLCTKIKVAGQTTEYVNKILEKYQGSDGTVMTMENYM